MLFAGELREQKALYAICQKDNEKDQNNDYQYTCHHAFP